MTTVPAARSGDPLIDARNLSRRFAQQVALAGVDLVVEPGELVVLMGPSGCGKTTLLNILGLLDRPDGGTLKLLGRSDEMMNDDDRARLRRRSLGHVFQFFHLLPHLTVQENVELPLILDGWPAKESEDRAHLLLARVGLADRRRDPVHVMSGGQMQRVAIARALAADPALLLADEPTGSLDQANGIQVLELLRELVAKEGRSVVMATHSMEAAEGATRVVRMLDGKVVSSDAGR